MTGTECGLFTYKSVPVIFEPPCTYLLSTMKLISLGVRQYVNSKGLEKPVMVCFVVMYHKKLKGLRKTTFNVSHGAPGEIRTGHVPNTGHGVSQNDR
jgi:hypothetical protein